MGTRLVQVANFYGAESGGLRTTVDALGSGYVDAGLERVLVVPGDRDADEDTAAGRRITMRSPRLPGSGGYRVLTDLERLRACLAEIGPDRLEVSDKLTLTGLGQWGRRTGVPTVLLSHERIDAILAPRLPRRVPLRTVANIWNRRLTASFDTIVCASEFAAAEYVRVGSRNVERIPLGVDLDAFRPCAGADHDGVRLVSVGRLSREKRPELAVDALRLLVGAGTDARLTMVGAGPMAAALVRRAEGLPVTFTGRVGDRAELAQLLATADVAIAPCPYETFGLSVLEALACGTPVVTADAGAAPELLRTGGVDRVGVAARSDPLAIAVAVTEILDWPDPPARRADARRRAERFSWARTVRSLLRVHGVEL